MKAFRDGAGRTWDVVVGRESWGALFAIFVPRSDGEGERGGGGHGADAARQQPVVRQAPLAGSGYDEANAELDAMADHDLRALLERSAPKQ